MSTQLCIQVSSIAQPTRLELDLIVNEEWTADSEITLLQKVQEILSLVRDCGTSVRINLEINATEPAEVMFRIRKKCYQHTDKEDIQQHKLSIREIEILGLIMLGYTNHEIADKLFISYETVRSHRKNMLTKTGARNTATLIKYYHQTFFDK